MSIAEQTVKVLSAESLRQTMSEANRRLAESFRQENVTLEYLHLYDTLLGTNEFTTLHKDEYIRFSQNQSAISVESKESSQTTRAICRY